MTHHSSGSPHSNYANPDALVSTDWLAERLDDPAVRVVDVDEDTDAYRRGHIPGAVGWDWNADLHHPVRRDYLGAEGLTDLLEAAGVNDGTTVVLYGGNDNWFAAYAYWLLSHRGFGSLRLLDGGRGKWEAEGRPLTREEPDLPDGNLSLPDDGSGALRAFRDDVLDGLGEVRFVDVRSPEEYRGEKLAPDHLPQEQPYVGGHVPGALNIPWARATRNDGTFRPVDELRAIYEGALERDEVIAYCRIGERAAHTWFVLHELLGHPNARNYDGSWTEYGSLVDVPVER